MLAISSLSNFKTQGIFKEKWKYIKTENSKSTPIAEETPTDMGGAVLPSKGSYYQLGIKKKDWYSCLNLNWLVQQLI